ncbi:hypothetical protein [Psychromonas sp. MME2]|uniref:hypothetical protein n=1 Tax=Psychromonas sp. MME2 TaxID=3231033 RepID=UPI00339C8835
MSNELSFSKAWSDEATLDIGGNSGEPIDVPQWSGEADLNLEFAWDSEPELEFVRVNPIPPTNVWSDKADLDIVKVWSADVDLDISPIDDSDKPPVTIIEGMGESYLASPITDSTTFVFVTGESHATLDGVSTNSETNIDINVYRGISLITESKTSNGTNVDCANESLFSDSPKQHNSNVVSIFDGEKLANGIVHLAYNSPKLSDSKEVGFFDGEKLASNEIVHLENRMSDIDSAKLIQFNDAPKLNADQLSSLYKHPPRADCERIISMVRC